MADIDAVALHLDVVGVPDAAERPRAAEQPVPGAAPTDLLGHERPGARRRVLPRVDADDEQRRIRRASVQPPDSAEQLALDRTLTLAAGVEERQQNGPPVLRAQRDEQLILVPKLEVMRTLGAAWP